MKFDAKSAREIEPGGFLSYAPAYPGLRLQAPQSGTWRAWTYRYRQLGTGKLRQVKLGVWPAMDWHRAIAAWVQARDERAGGTDPGAKAKAVKQDREQAAQAKQEATEQSVGWLVEEYLSGVVEPGRKPKGAAESRRMMTRAIAPYRGIPARELTHEQAHQMIRAIATAPRVAAMTRQELRACWEHGLSRRLVPANVFAGKTIGGRFKAVKRDRHLSD
jgi:hypothetical protein